jgi:alpha-glucosidase
LAPIRPLVLHYQQDEETKNLNGEFLFGEQMLVAPVLEQGANRKMVYLPKGIWFDYWTGEKIEGSNYFIRNAPIDICPIYVKSGSIIPNYKPMHYVGEQELDTLILDVYPGTGKYIHYQDNGENFEYRNGQYNQYEFVILADGTLKIELVHHGYEKIYRKIVIRYKGITKEFAFDEKPLTIWL